MCGSECAGGCQDFSKVLAASPDVPPPPRCQTLFLYLQTLFLSPPFPLPFPPPSSTFNISCLEFRVAFQTLKVRGCLPLSSLDLLLLRDCGAPVNDVCRRYRSVKRWQGSGKKIFSNTCCFHSTRVLVSKNCYMYGRLKKTFDHNTGTQICSNKPVPLAKREVPARPTTLFSRSCRFLIV